MEKMILDCSQFKLQDRIKIILAVILGSKLNFNDPEWLSGR